MIQLSVLLICNKFEAFDAGKALIVVGQPEIAVFPPVFVPAVLDNPCSVLRRLVPLAESGSRKCIVPAHHGYGMVCLHMLIGIVRVDL